MLDGQINRREALMLGGAAGLAVALPGTGARAAASRPAGPVRSGKVRNIIYMVSDGMSMGVPVITEAFSLQTRDKGTAWVKLMRDASLAHGQFDMASANSLVTDSAAAASSWGCGHRVNNRAINITPDGTKRTTITDIAHKAGRKVGLVSTTRITHATPAGFAAQIHHRDLEDQIAPQFLERVDVLMGGGRKFFSPELITKYQQAGYAVCESRDQMQQAKGNERILGLFGNTHLPFTLDHVNSAKLKNSTPTLAEMTRIALHSLNQFAHKGFLLQVEGGRIDHAAHANDGPAIIHDQLAFDDAVAVALEFAKDRDDTLIVVTTDHGNANPGLNGTGSGYINSNEVFARTANANVSFESIVKKYGTTGPTADDLAKHFGLKLSDEHAAILVDAFKVLPIMTKAKKLKKAGDRAGAQKLYESAKSIRNRLPKMIHQQFTSPYGIIGQTLANYTGIGWTGVSHTADFVIITATGPGQHHFAGLKKNTEAFVSMSKLMGVRV